MRDSNLKWEPYFADGVIDAEIAMIAETPGQGDSPEWVRNAQHAERPNLSVAGSIKEKISRRENGGGEKDNIGNLSFDIVSHNRIPREFFKIIGGTFQENLNSKKQIYFTNAKKCQNIEPDTHYWKNKKGYTHCKSYLIPELEAVGPDIILPLGEHATGQVFDELGSEWTGKLKSEIPIGFDNGLEPLPKKVREVDEYYVVPSYHWSFVNRSEYNNDYWKAVAQVIVEGCN
jgi:hypothetical protein